MKVKFFFFGVAATLAFMGLVGAAVVFLGLFPVNANQAPSALETWLATTAREAYVHRAAESMPPAIPVDDGVLSKGMELYEEYCIGCHGRPDMKENPMAEGFYPPVPQFATAHLAEQDAQEIFWVTKHGIRLTGMPSFEKVLTDEQIQQIAAFLINKDNLPESVKKEGWQ